ncbi:MAG: peptidase S16 [Alphaproteobacteria bacterium]|nr:peptidase S16 [Alphaproteobacteria bacterium]
MSERFQVKDVAELPDSLPIFPLAGVLLLPGGFLPLNIFEPRYLQMIEDALGSGRLIGMVQPANPAERAFQPEVYPLGCAGRLTAFKETDDGRYLITLKGVCRFQIGEELPQVRLYRKVRPQWTAFAGDLKEADEDFAIDKKRLFAALKPFFEVHGIKAEWPTLESVSPLTLVTSLAMMCPFEPREKQALLEAKTLAERTELLTALIEMAVMQKMRGPGANQ